MSSRLPFLALLSLAALPPAAAWEATPAIDLGFGGNSLEQISVHGVVGVNHERVFLSAKARASTEFLLFDSREPAESLLDYGLLGGPFWNRSWGYFSLGSGVSWLRYEERVGQPRDNPACDGWFCADSLYDTRVRWVPGLPLEALAVVKLWFIGLGVRLYVNTNPHDSFVGSGVVLFLGGGPTQRPDRRDEEN